MGFFRQASDSKQRFKRSPFALLLALVAAYGAYRFHWQPDPYRDGAEAFLRRDAATLQAAGSIRHVSLKRVAQGGCQPKCPTYTFTVVGTRAIVQVPVTAWSGPGRRLVFQIRPGEIGT